MLRLMHVFRGINNVGAARPLRRRIIRPGQGACACDLQVQPQAMQCAQFSQEEPSAEQQELILRNWGKLQRSHTSVEKAKLQMMEALSNCAINRNLSSYNRRSMLVRAVRPVCSVPST